MRFHTEGAAGGGSLGRVWLTLPLGTRSLTVGVRACGGALLTLSALPALHSNHSYWIALGASSNQRVTLRRGSAGGPPAAGVVAPGVVDCREARPFWVRWGAGSVEVGRGVVAGEGRLLYWRERRRFDVTAVSVGAEDGYRAEWLFTQHTGGYSQNTIRVAIHTTHMRLFTQHTDGYSDNTQVQDSMAIHKTRWQ